MKEKDSEKRRKRRGWEGGGELVEEQKWRKWMKGICNRKFWKFISAVLLS